jgi:hypothetical protein
MTARAIIDALGLPAEARVDQRVPKKLLLEQGVPTAADRRQIQDGVAELRWVAALKPNNVGVPAYRDEHREYLEIAVLTLELRLAAKSARIVELVHRAIPYPVVLVTSQEARISLSLAHKRFSQSEAGATVLDGEVATVAWDREEPQGDDLAGLAVGGQPRTDLLALYRGWWAWTEAVRAARITGRFVPAATPESIAARREALERHERLQREITGLRAQAGKETQLNRRVEQNLTIRRLEAELAEATANL